MKVTLNTPLQSGTDRHDAGDVVDLPKAAAQQLIDCAAAVLFDPVAAREAAKEAARLEAEAQAQADAAEKAATEAQAAADAAKPQT